MLCSCIIIHKSQSLIVRGFPADASPSRKHRCLPWAEIVGALRHFKPKGEIEQLDFDDLYVTLPYIPDKATFGKDIAVLRRILPVIGIPDPLTVLS